MRPSKLIPYLFILLLFACAPQSEETAANDDSTVVDPTPTTPVSEVTLTRRAEEADDAVEHNDDAKEDNAATRPAPTDTSEPAKPTAEQLTITPIPATQQATSEAAPAIKVPTEMQTFIETVIDDLVQQKGVQREAVSVVSIEEIVWNDGSLGCPQPGYAYTQALVDGFYIVLQANGTEYYYHTNGTRYFVLCEDHKGEPPTGGTHPDL